METLDEPLQIRGEEDLGKIKLHEHTNFKKTRKEILDFEKALSAAVKAHVNKLLNEPPHFSWVNSSLGSDWC
jgi:hypothetical protein